MPSRRLTLSVAVAAALGLTLGLGSCRATYPNRQIAGEGFPPVAVRALDGAERSLPAAVAGAPAVLLLGYVQGAQFDADRWLLGLLQAELAVRIVEVPAARGFVPWLIRGTIDGGMRAGIPAEDWGVVWTVYGEDADRLQRFTGNERPRNVRALLLDADGRVVWSHDRGYSAGTLLALRSRLAELQGATGSTGSK